MTDTLAQRPPFRVDHVGSLLRPAELRHAFRDHAQGKLSDADFKDIQDKAIRDVIRMQEAVGLSVVNDGEFRRGSYWSRFVQLTQGFTIRNAIYKFHDDQGHDTEFTAPHVQGRLRRTGPITVDEFAFGHALTGRTVKVTMPSPSTMHFWRGSQFQDAGVYADLDAFFSDLAGIYRAEIAELGRAGCRYVQLDEVPLAMLCDPSVRERVRADGYDADQLVVRYVDAINEAVRGRPQGMAVGVHMCRGNFKGKYLSEGGYDHIAETLFQRADVTHFLLEFDTARAGDFAPLRFVPKDKGVVIGIMSSKLAALESVDDLRRRIDEASRHIDLDRLGISPQCGFASTVAGNPVTEEVERAKLARLVETARQVWG